MLDLTMEKKSVAIVGGGLGGLTVGYRLAKNGYEVNIFEKEKDLGGLVASFQIEGHWLEKSYHHIFKTDRAIIGLIRELGLENKLEWQESKVGIYYNQRLYPFTTPMDLIRFEPLPIIDRIRMGLVGLLLQKDGRWQKYIEQTAEEWMKKYGGERGYKVVWEPLLKGKFHDWHDKVSMAWLWARIHTRGNSKDKDGKERLGYLRGGFGQMVKKLAEEITKAGGKIDTGEKVEEKELTNRYGTVISTRPGKGIDYLGAITMVFCSRQKLSNYYWHNINELGAPFLALIEHTNFVDKKDYGGKEIYYLGTYAPHNHKYFKMTDDEIEKEWFGYLKTMFKDFSREMVERSFIFRFKYAQHVVGTDYQRRLSGEKEEKNIHRLNFSQIFPEDRGMNYAVTRAEELAKRIIEKEKCSTG